MNTSSPALDRQDGIADRLADAATRLLDQATRDRDELASALTGLANRVIDRAVELRSAAWRAVDDSPRVDQLGADLAIVDETYAASERDLYGGAS